MTRGTPTEAAEYAAFMRRALRAFIRRAGDDPETLRMLVDFDYEVQRAIAAAVRRAHDVEGYSYGEIAARLGTSRQAVRQRVERQRGVVD